MVSNSQSLLTWSLLTPDDSRYARSLTGEVLGVRMLPDGRREYLCMNKALDPQQYSVMVSAAKGELYSGIQAKAEKQSSQKEETQGEENCQSLDISWD